MSKDRDYLVVTGLRIANRRTEPGEVITLSEADAAKLIRLGAISATPITPLKRVPQGAETLPSVAPSASTPTPAPAASSVPSTPSAPPSDKETKGKQGD
jgi:hypothetical protein